MKQKISLKTILAGLLLSLATAPLSAAAEFQYTTMESLPGFGRFTSSNFEIYIRNIFSLGIWLAGISAMLMIMVGGYLYMTSAGNNASMEKAKKYITDAIIGLILALLSWLLLYTINPELIKINPIKDSIDTNQIKDPGSEIKIKPIDK